MEKRSIAAILSFSVVAVFFIFTVLLMHPFGAPDSTAMDDDIISNAQTETGANNAVTSVVFDYRGYDTLGEATVLFTAIAGVMIMFRKRREP